MCAKEQTLAYHSLYRSVMRKLLQTLAISALLLAPASAVQAQVSIGIRIGPPPGPRAYRTPAQPGPDYEWIEGYWYPQGGHYLWHAPYWTRPPYAGAYWVAPYYEGGRYITGQWEGSRGNVAHNHGWDRARQRDERRSPQSNAPPAGRGRTNAPPPSDQHPNDRDNGRR